MHAVTALLPASVLAASSPLWMHPCAPSSELNPPPPWIQLGPQWRRSSVGGGTGPIPEVLHSGNLLTEPCRPGQGHSDRGTSSQVDLKTTVLCIVHVHSRPALEANCTRMCRNKPGVLLVKLRFTSSCMSCAVTNCSRKLCRQEVGMSAPFAIPGSQSGRTAFPRQYT